MRFVLRARRAPAACVVMILTAFTALTAGCASPEPAGSTDGGGRITVFAASSLTDVVESLNAAYDGGGRLRVNVGSSSQLVAQLQSGAEADVVITADLEALEPLRNGLDREAVLASNQLVLALAAGNPAGITVLRDVAADRVRAALCAPSVPCGRAADRVLAAAGVAVPDPSLEDSARSVLTKVSSGQADAGLVYRTDALAAAEAGVTYLPLSDPGPNRYPAALTAQGAENTDAAAFFDWLTGPDAAAILAEAGFGPPEPGSGPADTAPGSTDAP
ncbi:MULTISPECIES: molybdate ABC transporter substrate-binding protein [unclassified Arthrobacter]|uniref:molybdate ABC transporter substrate-binding protein n=1 Tax=unclassified Arthrobacter TaxID=235627 RepID=UPI001E336E1B|nr:MULTISPECIES: molybdate ABC transporter substrate-binding protein [unclassified Arthrobacter]MCC9146277.1 molybdate ABC transporter substrate-binding protein [Arthrobacter sp. zg-Y919]MDK1277507.1 molybdate ABC transporter substrate-binding protein [Arthrobacter sp. zg.Y919]WIB03993.1 molybdate ABC transporter substrate-binding protein [Arthrobacter sp. zg-Y919]